MKETKITGLILSAGFSLRMKKFKPLINYKGKPFIKTVAEKLVCVCDNLVVVTGFKSLKIIEYLLKHSDNALLKKTEFVFNKRYEKGMFTSLKKGVFHAKDSDWVLYHFVDQPSVPEDFYSPFANEIDSAFDVVQPVYRGRKGHPILLGKKAMNLILEADDDDTLKNLIKKNNLSVKLWECEFPEILKDFDYPEDLGEPI